MILVDSDVLIAHLRGQEPARDWLLRARRESGTLAISVVSVVEIAGGMRSAERAQVRRLLSSMHSFPVTERIAWSAAELMRTYRRAQSGIGLGDYLLAATADVEGLQLATLNVRHFPSLPGLQRPLPVGPARPAG